MPAEVESEVLLVEVDGGVVADLAGGLQLLQGGVGAGNVGGVVAVVVKLHDAPGDVGFERGAVVGKWRNITYL